MKNWLKLVIFNICNFVFKFVLVNMILFLKMYWNVIFNCVNVEVYLVFEKIGLKYLDIVVCNEVGNVVILVFFLVFLI